MITSKGFTRAGAVRLARITALTALGSLAIATSLAAGSGTASAQTVPWTDRNASGFIALCDANGNNVTSGDVNAAPFVWKAVASQPPPANYQGAGENAVLEIFQPRPNVDPGQWSGDTLTAASFYKTADLPAVEGTSKDLRLADIIAEFPPMVDGLYQLRMGFGKKDYGLFSNPYPATTIQVTGDTWHVVQGGQLPCPQALTVSNEVLVGVAKSGPQQPSGATAGASSHAGSSKASTHPGSSASSSTTGAAAGASAATSGSTAATPVLSAARSSGGGSAPVLAGIGALALLGAGGGFWALRARRRSAE